MSMQMVHEGIVEVVPPSGPLTAAEARRYEKLKATFGRFWFQDRFMAGAAIKEIRDSHLYRQEYPTFVAFCEKEYEIKEAHAYRLIEAAEVKESLQTSPMGEVLKNERQVRALKAVPAAEREEVLKAAAETGAVTAKSITEVAKQHAESKPAKPAKPEKPPARYDHTGYEIPEKILPDWDRAEETAKRMLKPLSDLRSELKRELDRGLKDRDIIFAEINNAVIADINNAYGTLKCVRPYAVCSSCAGHNRAKCSLCKRRGFLSHFAWNSYVPAEIKKIRSKGGK